MNKEAKRRVERAVRRAAEAIEVPGTPRSLRLEDVRWSAGGGLVLSWSFEDPETFAGDRRRRRIHGETNVRVGQRGAEELATGWWVDAQLAAGHRYKDQVDADFLPGEPFVPRTWEPEEAWAALVRHLGAYGAEVRSAPGQIRVTHEDEVTTYRIDPVAWAAYISDPEKLPLDGGDVVPVAFPRAVDGLPLWVVDELLEVAGSRGPVVGLVDGRLEGLAPRVRLRKMTLDDVAQVIDVQEPSSALGLAAVFPQDDYPFPRDEIARRWGQEVVDPAVDCLVIECDGILGGFAALRGDEFLHFGVGVQWWGSGAAQLAHDAVLEGWQERGVRRAWLRVFEDNARGRAFYEKLGWKATGERTRSTFAPYALLLHYERDL